MSALGIAATISRNINMLSAERIAEAKSGLHLIKPFHEHDDSIHIAYQWFDGQPKLKNLPRNWGPIKHVIEQWGGRYVSQDDVEVAAFLHPEIFGKYPRYNIQNRLTLPAKNRLLGISSAGTQRYRLDPRVYTYFESEEDLIPLLMRRPGYSDRSACRGSAAELWDQIRDRGYGRRRPW
jgi:hypothetical protein